MWTQRHVLCGNQSACCRKSIYQRKMNLDIQVSKLQLLKQSYLSQKYEMEDKVMTYFPQQIKEQEKWIAEYKEDLAHVKEYTPKDRETFPPMQIQGTVYADKKEAGQALIAACKAMKSNLRSRLYLEHMEISHVLTMRLRRYRIGSCFVRSDWKR